MVAVTQTVSPPPQGPSPQTIQRSLWSVDHKGPPAPSSSSPSAPAAAQPPIDVPIDMPAVAAEPGATPSAPAAAPDR